MKKNLFITLEGIEGAGKSTVIDFIENFITSSGYDVVKTREPGGTAIGEQVREILLNKNNDKLTDDTELLLIFAARAQHLSEIILPNLTSNKIVLCDRFIDASYAYQGAGRGIEQSKINLLENWVMPDIKPDLTFLLDLDPKIAFERTNKRSDADRFESEDIHFFEKIRQYYLERAENEPERFRVINSELSLEDVQEQIKNILKDMV
ncbi:MAG: dTMP kinase [Legionellales bacterium]|nr:dTMP kinase [Legionellales bacterium]|tara:strand:+ start:114 stop:734 length:621 start_codon:yes stop_codon:yes gene_type:complete